MNRYQLIRGFDTHDAAQDYANRLPSEAQAKVVPYRDPSRRPPGTKPVYLFAIDVHRDYVGGRL